MRYFSSDQISLRILFLRLSTALFVIGLQTSCMKKPIRSDVMQNYKNPDLANPEYRLSLTKTDETSLKQFFDLIKPGEKSDCPRNTFANGLGKELGAIHCMSTPFFDEKPVSQVIQVSERSVRCQNNMVSTGVWTNSEGNLIALTCQKLLQDYGTETEVLSISTPDASDTLNCDPGSFLKGLSLTGDGEIEAIDCVTLSGVSQKSFQLTSSSGERIRNLSSYLDQSDKVIIRSKYLSVSGDYYIFVGDRQVGIADGIYFNAGVKYNLLDMQGRFYMQTKEEIFTLLSKLKFYRPEAQNSIPYKMLSSANLKNYLRMETPLELAIGRNMELFNGNDKIGHLDQKNFTFLREFNIYDLASKQFFVDQKFHLFRRVYEVSRTNVGSLSMSDMVMATIALDRMALRRR